MYLLQTVFVVERARPSPAQSHTFITINPPMKILISEKKKKPQYLPFTYSNLIVHLNFFYGSNQ